MIDNKDGTVPNPAQPLLNASRARKFGRTVLENQDSQGGDLFWASLFGILACTTHPIVPCATAGAVDFVYLGVYAAFGLKGPRTIFTGNAMDAYTATREYYKTPVVSDADAASDAANTDAAGTVTVPAKKGIKPTDALPCGWVGIFAGMCHNVVDHCRGTDIRSTTAGAPVPGAMN